MTPSHSQPESAATSGAEPSAAFTPGPWSIKAPWSGFSAIEGPDGELIFGLAAGDAAERLPVSVIEANARLVAAAPDAIDIVRRLIAADDGAPEFGLTDCIDNYGEHYQSADFAALIVDARLVLAKALGADPKAGA